jgi:hypothetical protein
MAFCEQSLRWLKLIFLALQRKVLRYPKITLGIFGLVLIAGLLSASKLKMLLVIDDLIDRDFKTYSQLKNLNLNFLDKNNLYLIVSPKSGELSKKTVCDLSLWVQKLVLERRDIERIISSFGVRHALSNKNELQLPQVLKYDCSRPNLDESALIKEGLQKIKASPWGAVLTSKTANDLFLGFYISDTLGAESHTGPFDTSIVGNLIQNFDKTFLQTHPDVEGSWGGVGVFQYYLKLGYDQTALLNFGTVSVLFILFWFLFGTLKSSFLFILSFLFALIPTYGGMAIFHAPIDVLSNNLSFMVLIASLEDFVFISCSRMNASVGKKMWRRPFRLLLLPSFFTSLTTFIGFGSLVTADMDIIRRFGVWAAFAVGMEFISSFYFLPALLRAFPSLQNWAKPTHKTRLSWAEKLKLGNIPKWLALASLCVYLIGGTQARTLTIHDAPQNIFPEDHIVRKTLKKIEDSRGWQTEISLVFKNYEQQKTNEEKLALILQDSQIRAHENPYEIERYLRRDLTPPRAEAVLSLWDQSPLSRRLVNRDQNEGRAMLYLGNTDIVDTNRLTQKVSDICQDDCHLAGTLISYGEFGEKVLSTFLASLALSLTLVALILIYLIVALKQKEIFSLLASALWGPFVMLTIFVIFKIPIFYVTSIFASILIGLAGDNTIQFLFANARVRSAQGFESFGGISLVITACMCILSTVLFFSYFAPVRTLGLLMITGFVLSVIGDLFILKALRK